MEIVLSNGMSVEITKDDYDLVKDYNWYAHKTKNTLYARGYKRGERRSKLVYMHRILLNVTKDLVVDHMDGNGLNNTRGNIRLVTKSFNNINTPNRKGYYFCKSIGKYRIETTIGNKKKYIGLANSPEEARIKYIEYIKDIQPMEMRNLY